MATADRSSTSRPRWLSGYLLGEPRIQPARLECWRSRRGCARRWGGTEYGSTPFVQVSSTRHVLALRFWHPNGLRHSQAGAELVGSTPKAEPRTFKTPSP